MGKVNKKVAYLFKRAEELTYSGMVYKQSHTQDYGHGRIENREYTVLPMMYLPKKFKDPWCNLQTLIQVCSSRELLIEQREYLTD